MLYDHVVAITIVLISREDDNAVGGGRNRGAVVAEAVDVDAAVGSAEVLADRTVEGPDEPRAGVSESRGGRRVVGRRRLISRLRVGNYNGFRFGWRRRRWRWHRARQHQDHPLDN